MFILRGVRGSVVEEEEGEREWERGGKEGGKRFDVR